MCMIISYDDFRKVDIRLGKIIAVEDFPKSRKPSFKLTIDFGEEIGIKKSIGRFPDNYSQKSLQGLLVACVVNLESRQIGPGLSEVLTLGFPDENGSAVLVSPSKEAPLGGKLF